MQYQRFATFAWGVLVYTLAIILWGGYVRATGSGAGCGSHWPLCNGEVIPRSPEAATLIEFGHRLSSGLAFLLVVVLLVLALRLYPRGAAIRRAAWFALFFMITESLVGAALVLFSLVGDNTSIYRAIWMAVHLINTFFLLIPLTLIPWWASGHGQVQVWRQGALLWALLGGLIGVLWLSASGAVTALGDTLFPASSLAEGIRQDFSPAAHVLVRLRIWHPILAVLIGLYLFGLVIAVRRRHRAPEVQRLGGALIGIFCLQGVVGLFNVALLAPVWLQMVHLLMANLVWITLLLLSVETLAQQAPHPVRPAMTTQQTIPGSSRPG
jgi:heme A synthase